jgi:hypothetical protein
VDSSPRVCVVLVVACLIEESSKYLRTEKHLSLAARAQIRLHASCRSQICLNVHLYICTTASVSSTRAVSSKTLLLRVLDRDMPSAPLEAPPHSQEKES